MYVYKERALWAVASIDKTQTKHLVEENLQTLFFLLFSLFLIFPDFRTEDFFIFFLVEYSSHYQRKKICQSIEIPIDCDTTYINSNFSSADETWMRNISLLLILTRR